VVDGLALFLSQVNELPSRSRRDLPLAAISVAAGQVWHRPRDTVRCSWQRLVTLTARGHEPGRGRHPAGIRLSRPLLYLELVDTRLNQIEVMLFIVNDPAGARMQRPGLAGRRPSSAPSGATFPRRSEPCRPSHTGQVRQDCGKPVAGAGARDLCPAAQPRLY